MPGWLDWIVDTVSYDAQRDFYAKHFPGVREREIFFRRMRKKDLPEIVAIEARAYEFPWSEGTFHDCLKAGYHCWIGEHKEQIAAYGILSVAVGEAHLFNLCIDPSVQGRGFGRKFLQKLIDEARTHYAQTLFLEVRPSNTVARRLYHDMGFNEVGLRKGYYQAKNGREDALLLALTLCLDA